MKKYQCAEQPFCNIPCVHGGNIMFLTLNASAFPREYKIAMKH